MAGAIDRRQTTKQPSSDVPAVSGQDAATGGKRTRAVGVTAEAQAAERMPSPPQGFGKQKTPYGTWLKLPEAPATARQGASQRMPTPIKSEHIATAMLQHPGSPAVATGAA